MTTDTQRVALSRILAVNWYGFRQIIDVEGATVIAGGFGTGKSALLDLIQYVMLGGQQWRPNRAAAGRGKSRDLVSYCLCDTNTERNGQTHYVRSSGVTIAALEFTWPGNGEPRRETWGMRVEYSSPTAEPKQSWFFVPERLEWSDLAPDGLNMLSEEAFRINVRRDFEGAVFNRATDYLDEMATPKHLHFDRPQMNKTMPKAIAFEPEENFEKFIRDFLLEKNPVDVKEVKQSLGAHREMQARLARLHDEAGFLRRISEKHGAYATALRRAALFGHAKRVLAREEAAEKLRVVEATLARETEKHVNDIAELKSATAELEKVTALYEEVRLEASRDTDSAKLAELEKQKRTLNHKIAQLREAKQNAATRLNERATHWGGWLRRGESLGLEGLDKALQIDSQHLTALRSGATPEAMNALGTLAQRFNDIFLRTGELRRPLEEGIGSAEKKLQGLARELDSIGQEQTPGAFPLFNALKQRLDRAKRIPEQVCRLVEVKPTEERWWTALEVFLGRNRFALVVDESDYPAALKILSNTPPGRDGEALINPKEARAMERPPKPNSLATKVEVADPVARAFINHLLGDVICVETIEDLDRVDASRAITPDGVFKQAPTRRRLRDDNERRFTLGREGLERMKRERLQQQTELRAQRDTLQRQCDEIKAWLESGQRAGLGNASLPDRSAELPQLPELEKEFGIAVETANLLRTPEREARLEQLHSLDHRKGELGGKVAVLASENKTFFIRQQQLTEQCDTAREVLDQADHDLVPSRGRMPAGISDSQIEEFMRPLLDSKAPWRTRIQNAQEQETSLSESANELKHARNLIRRELVSDRDERGALKHTNWLEQDLEEESNAAWETRLNLLLTHELERHQNLAQERKKEWEDRLKDQVLDKLNERLRAAEVTVKRLRQYLDCDVGRHRYRISQKRDSAMSSIWHLLDTGFEPTDELMRSVKTEEIEHAKEELMRAVEAAESQQPDERAVRLLDYRNYHRYDVVMVPKEGGAEISLTRSVSKMSGGENQAPFFACMLAAFHRVYDVGSLRFRQNLGLVVMDEAFSKLSGDGIEDCLGLARNFQLQLLMAVPIDRLGVMHSYAATTILCNKFEQRSADGYIARIDNVPTRLTPDQVREAIE